jgi:uncharacterized membrane protein YeiH
VWRSSPPPRAGPPGWQSASTSLAWCCVAALGGGLLRDVVIDDFPPLAFGDWRYSAVAAAASLLVFFLHPQLARIRRTVLVLDAAGLGLFTAAGTLKALDFGVPVVGGGDQ